jgi:hypothetical protein
VLDQVDVAINDRAGQSPRLICNMPEVEGAPVIEECKKVSMVWNQLSTDKIHLFVKISPAGEQKPFFCNYLITILQPLPEDSL